MESILRSNTGIRAASIFLATLFISSCTLSLRPLEETIQEEVENAVEGELDGIIVCVHQPETTRFFTAGWNNREHQIPMEPDALFKIASISKLYIAVATTKLANEGRLDLNKSLAAYLPDLANRIEYADEITLKMMVQHRSGIPNFTDDPDFPWDSPPKHNRETLELVLDESADFKPDKKERYSNTNYLLIGEIIDQTLGYSHHQYIKDEILIPLGLQNTYSLLAEVDIDEVCSGYYIDYEPDIKNNDYIAPGGSMVATAEDVAIFLRALNDGSLLNEEEQEIYSSLYRYEHTGLLPGYSSIAKYNEKIDATVIQFVNTSGGNSTWFKTERVYNRIIRVLKKED